MPLTPGTRLGSYEILAPLGAGGMGEVYRARDTRLNREVAIKVLPELVAADPNRLARFEREAQAVAALSHPNILAIHDFGASGSTTYAVMELLEGVTLREELGKGPLPLRKATDYAGQIARGLAAAHEKGVVHRDLKPENLFITSDERAKILDFGLARQVAPSSGAEQTFAPASPLRTDPGTVLGTVGYMAPEQVRGEPGDQRSDIFSFGAVLYEMVTGRRAFARATPAETMTAILREDAPDPTAMTPQIPPSLARIIWHCLEKKPEARFRSAHDLAFALETTLTSSSAAAGATTAGLVARRDRPRYAIWLAAAALLGLTGVGGFWLGRSTGTTTDAASTVAAPSFRRLTFERGLISRALFAPDAQTVVFSASWNADPFRVFLTRLDSRGATRLPMPDGLLLSIATASELGIGIDVRPGTLTPRVTLAQTPMLSGSPRPLVENVTFAEWNSAGTLAVVRIEGARQRLEAPPGNVLYETSGEIGHPRFSRSGDRIAFLDWPVKNDDRGTVAVVDLKGQRRTISRAWEAVRGVAWSPANDEVWYTAATEGTEYSLMASTLDGRERIVFRAPNSLQIHDVRPDGRVLVVRYERTKYVGGLFAGDANERDLSLFDYSWARDISRDGRLVALTYSGPGSGRDYEVYLRDVRGGQATRIGSGQAQQFSPDGKWVLSVVHGPPAALLLLPTGPGQSRTLQTGGVAVTDARWLPDGRRFIAIGSEQGRTPRAYVIDIEGGGPPRAISPEGVTFESNLLAVARDGSFVALRAPDRRVMLFRPNGGEPVVLAGLEADEMPIGWTPESKSVLVWRTQERGAIDRVDIASGRRDRWLQLRPPEKSVLSRQITLAFGADGKSYAANYERIQTELYLVEGLK
jgi:eukaryotic-like serine/threonine-protein kinase